MMSVIQIGLEVSQTFALQHFRWTRLDELPEAVATRLFATRKFYRMHGLLLETERTGSIVLLRSLCGNGNALVAVFLARFGAIYRRDNVERVILATAAHIIQLNINLASASCSFTRNPPKEKRLAFVTVVATRGVGIGQQFPQGFW